jgi:hypothetical protein
MYLPEIHPKTLHLNFTGSVSADVLRIVTSFPGASFRYWRQFSPGRFVRPAWLLITIAALLRLSAGVPIGSASEWGELSGPLHMVFLACGLFYLLKACRQIGGISGFLPAPLVLPKPSHAARHARTRRLRDNFHPQRGTTSTKTNAFAPNSKSK